MPRAPFGLPHPALVRARSSGDKPHGHALRGIRVQCVHAAATDESTIQAWAVRRDRQAKAGIAVSALPASPKAGDTPFGGSQLCFALTEDGVCTCFAYNRHRDLGRCFTDHDQEPLHSSSLLAWLARVMASSCCIVTHHVALAHHDVAHSSLYNLSQPSAARSALSDTLSVPAQKWMQTAFCLQC